MRSFTPKIIAAAAVLAALPISGAYAAHRHHRPAVDTQAITAAVPMDKEARAAYDQLQGVRQGILEARELGKITPEQAHGLLMEADGLHAAALRSGGGESALFGQINDLDQRLQDMTGQGTYIGDGSDGGYYPNG